MVQTVVYTANFGGRDKPRELLNPDWTRTARYVYFTDDPQIRLSTWEVVVCSGMSDYRNHRVASRWYKIRPHIHMLCDQSVWIDANLVPRVDLAAHFESFSQPWALFRHFRPTVQSELNVLRHRIYDSPQIIHEVTEQLAARNELGARLLMGGVLFRRHTLETCTTNDLWWQVFQDMGLQRDQPSLAVALHRSGMECCLHPWVSRGRFIAVRSHRNTRHRRQIQRRLAAGT